MPGIEQPAIIDALAATAREPWVGLVAVRTRVRTFRYGDGANTDESEANERYVLSKINGRFELVLGIAHDLVQ